MKPATARLGRLMPTIWTRHSPRPCRPWRRPTARTSSMVEKSVSKNAPGGGGPGPRCGMGLAQVEAFEAAGGIAEVFHADAHSISHGDKEVAHGGFAACDHAAAGLDGIAAAANDE